MDKTLASYDIIYEDSDNINLFNSSYDLSGDITNQSDKLIDVLHPEETRWFYRSVLHSHCNVFRPFSGYDSLRLETKFRELSSFKGESALESSVEKIIVKRNLFEADVIKRICIPIYWTDVENNFDIYRGTWFIAETFEPLVEQLADSIEAQFIMNFRSLSYTCMDGDSNLKIKKVLHSITYTDYLIEWYGLNEVYLYDTRTVAFRMKQLRISDPTKFGQKLIRGYKVKTTFDDKPQEITHLCFVVHGIGQRLAGHINRQCNKLKQCYKKVLKKYYCPSIVQSFRIEFLPIEWRTSLNLDGGIVDAITPKEFKGLRTIFNNTVMDILYYSSSLYRNEIVHGLQSEINRIYSMFCSRNPYFESQGGKVSIIAHSLGSVICYDIINTWGCFNMNLDYAITPENHTGTSEEVKSKIQSLNIAKDRISSLEVDLKNIINLQTNLPRKGGKEANFPSNFKEGILWKEVNKIENFFMLGSPLPVFLALKGFKPRAMINPYDIIPKHICKKLYNIYHISDPFAYRIEPLLMKDYFHIDPVHIKILSIADEVVDYKRKFRFSFKTAPDNSNIKIIPPSENESTTSIESDKEFNYRRNSIQTHFAKRFSRLKRGKSLIPAVDDLQLKFDSLKEYPLLKRIRMFLNILKGKEIVENEEMIFDDSLSQTAYLEDLKLKQRLDYTLGEDSGINSYVSLLTSHTSYWEDLNLTKFLIDQIIKES